MKNPTPPASAPAASSRVPLHRQVRRLWIARKPNGAPLFHTISGSQSGCWKILLARWRKHLPGLLGIMGAVTKAEAKRGGITVTRCELSLPAHTDG